MKRGKQECRPDTGNYIKVQWILQRSTRIKRGDMKCIKSTLNLQGVMSLSKYAPVLQCCHIAHHLIVSSTNS